jgi:hypothetical protein
MDREEQPIVISDRHLLDRETSPRHSFVHMPPQPVESTVLADNSNQMKNINSNEQKHKQTPQMQRSNSAATSLKTIEDAHLVDDVIGRPISKQELAEKARMGSGIRRNSYNQFIDMFLQQPLAQSKDAPVIPRSASEQILNHKSFSDKKSGSSRPPFADQQEKKM